MSSYFHSASQSCPILSANCRYNIRLFRSFRVDSLGIDKSSWQNVSYTVMLWKGSQVPQGDDEEAVTINQGIGDIRFTNILKLFSIYFFFSITLLSHFFYTFFHPRHLPTPTPTPTPTTHALYPRPTTHDPRHLATLVTFWGLISIATLRLRCHDLIYRCLCANPTLFWNKINRMHSYMYFWIKEQPHGVLKDALLQG